MATDPVTQMNKYRSYVTMLADPVSKDELKLKAAQELSENFEIIMCSSQYPAFLDHMMTIFLKILEEGEPHFISEYNIQQIRKLILEMIHRLPSNEYLRRYVRQILTLMSRLLETDNEENVLVCLRIIIELHKQYKPTFNPEIQYFLQFVKSVYSELPKNLSKIFEPRPPLRVKDLSEINIEALLKETFTITAIQSEKKAADGNVMTYNLIPKAVLSLKVLQELPIIVVLMNQLYKQNVHQDVSDFVPIVITTISLQPSLQHRASPGFNKEVFVDFMGAQIKTLSFLAYVIRLYQDVITQNSSMLVKGILGLFTLCPMEVAHLRKELVIASRHILATDLRNQFIPHMEVFFNEDIFIGHGWTAHEALRPLAYSTLADLVHHVRLQLPLNDVSRAVHLYGKNLLDQTLPTAVQRVSCKLLMNLVDTVRQRSDAENSTQGRELLMRILLVFVLKFKTIAKIYIPILRNKAKQVRPAPVDNNTTEDAAAKPCINVNEEKEPPKSKFGFPASQAMSYNVADYRDLVKSLVHGAKAITANCINRTGDVTQANQLAPKETLIYIQLIKWALPALDIYTIGPPVINPPVQPDKSGQFQIRTREEKEVLELFGNVFTQMSPQTFQEIFSMTIDYMVERIFKNCALQIIGNTFLTSHTISSTFATILVEYLLERMGDMGSNVERSNLYLRLFKFVFGSVSRIPENEHLLRPHLNLIVNRAMELAMSAKESYNYFLLLRALFRSIGGGSHDLLYQEFLPLLPNMLEGLNRLQSGLHRQHMKDLFVELCLTVPVRLSSLLPYLPMLMDPLVSALNGSYCLVSQGLRTLELCVDNLQPDFLYEHIQPIRAELMQALWRTLQNSTDQAHVAFRILGKFGGGNRRMMIEPQKLEYNDRETSSPNVIVYFEGASQPIDFPMEKVIEAAFNALKSNTTDLFYRKQCWEVIYCYLAASLRMDETALWHKIVLFTYPSCKESEIPPQPDTARLWRKLFTHSSFKEGEIPHQQEPHYKCPDTVARNVQQTALTSMFLAAEIKDLRQSVINTVAAVVRHYTMIAIAQQAGLFNWTERDVRKDTRGQDPLVLIDALAVIMAHDEKELYKTGYFTLVLILKTATSILGSKERACQLPFMEYLAERMCSLCYERAWYAKLGGCIAIKFLFERMATKWVLNHLFVFLKALVFVMMDLTDEVSNGAIDMAKENLEKMLRVCVNPGIREDNAELIEAQNKSLYEVTRELVKQVTSPHTIVREQAMASLRQLAEIQNKTVTEVMEPHKEVLADMMPPKKHLLKHQPANAQIGLMDGNTFCTTLNPRLFTIDLNIQEHKIFFNELLSLCESDEANFNKLACYKSISNLMPLRKSALRALAACHYIVGCREKIFSVLYKTLERSNAELQEAAYECMKMFISGFQIDMESVHTIMRPMLLTLGDHRNLSLNCVRRLLYLTKLFPSTFSVALCEQLLAHLKKLLDSLVQSHKGISTSGETEQKITTIINIFYEVPSASVKFIDILCKLVLQAEKSLQVEVSSPFRPPLIKFLLRYPAETLNLFLHDSSIKDQQWSRYLEHLIKHKDAKPLRDILHNSTTRLVTMLLAHSQTASTLSFADKSELQYRAIKIIGILIKFDEQWLSTQHQLVGALKQIWCNDDYQALHKKVESVEYCHWKEPKHIVKILLHYFRHQPNDIDLLFQLLRATCDRFVPDFQFLRDFLENTVAQEYTVEWKRAAFFRFVEHFPTNNMSQELKANVLQLIIIPCFAVSFERGDGTKLVGGAPMPYQDNPENVVSVFISKIIDPDNPFGSADCVRISLLQFSCLLVEQASQHIHDVTNKRQGNKLRRLMTFAWPCLLIKNCVDPTTRYHGHLLLSHIIAKFAIHKRIVLQVFHSLLKAHAVDARNVVRQALEILTPAMPVRMEDGNTMLTHWTKKIIVEEGHSMQQLFHILQLVVRHYKVYYPVRHHLVQHIVNSIQRMGFSPTATIEHRRLAVELAEVIIKWELYRIKEEAEATESNSNKVVVQPSGSNKRLIVEDPSGKRMSCQATPSGNSPVPLILPRMEPGSAKPIERIHADAVLNFLLRLACQVNDVTTIHGNPGEQLFRRCVSLLKMALKPDVWVAEQCDLKLAWLDKVLASVDSPQCNYGNISTALEVLTFLLGVMKREQILTSFKPLQRGIGACIASSNTKIVRLVHGLLSRLMTIFPAEPTSSNVASKYEELDTLYSTVGRFIAEGLATYEKTTTAVPSSLFGTLMMLKAACTNNPNYIDRLITPFMRVLHRMAKEHLHSGQNETNPVTSELLILSLDLVKNRVVVMGVDMRKSFIGTILVGLIEKTQDAKVMKAITKILEEWMKNKTTIAINQAPSLREKSILLVKMMQYVEKRFPEDTELNKQFLELVNYVYRDESLKLTELTSKLEQAFLAGLRCGQPQVRAKFFEVFDGSMKRLLPDRLLYIIVSQNWENIGPHYWIKQCIELLLATVNSTTQVQITNEDLLLPSIMSIMHGGMEKDNEEQMQFVNNVAAESQDIDMTDRDTKETFLEIDAWMSNLSILSEPSTTTTTAEEITEKVDLVEMISKQVHFMENAKKIKTEQLLLATAQLCHMDTSLAERVWLDMFPRIWGILDEIYLRSVMAEIPPFVASGAHVIQKDCHPSALGTFLEALAHCDPPVAIAPPVMKYLGKSHNVWHRITLSLEQMAAEMATDINLVGNQAKIKCEPDLCRASDEVEQSEYLGPYYEVVDMLSAMYSLLCEEDMWSGLWQKRPAYYKETLHAIALEQQGFFEQAQGAYEVCFSKYRQDFATGSAPYLLNQEVLLWERHWERTAKELNQWEILLDLGNHNNYKNPFLVLESAWRIPNWQVMKDILTQVEHNCPREMAWKINLYRGFLTLCNSEEQHLSAVERYVELASGLCMREWRRLPHIVSHVHQPLLQAAQQIMELQEAMQIHQGLLHGRSNSLHDMKATVKTWRNRLPVIADDLSHWSDIFTWRQHHYTFISNHYDSQQDQTTNHSLLGVHASMQAIIHFGKIARKQNLCGVCLDSLAKIYSIPTSVPMIDCFKKIKQQVKCYLQMATMGGQSELQEGLDMLESTNMSFFTKEMIAEFYAWKGLLQSQLGRSDDANKSFSAAVQLQDTLVKAWSLWGDYLENIFIRDARQINIGISALICYLHACRHQNESKSRKYIAKILWLLTYDDDKSSLMETVDKYAVGVPAIQWLPWVPQLLMYLVRHENNIILNLLSQVGRMFPQAVYFSIRTLYLTLKIEQRERYKSSELAAGKSQDGTEDRGLAAAGNVPQQQGGVPETSHSIPMARATPPMWRCSKIMHLQRDIHPTVLSSLEGIVDQMVWFRETWYEEVLRQLRQGLAKCYAIAFENRGAVSEATITEHTLNFVKKLVSTFGIGIENISSSQNMSNSFSSAGSESLARRAQATVQDPVFHKMKGQFTSDFDFDVPGARLLHNLINKLKKWIKILEEKTKQLPKSFLIEEKCRFLSNFSLKTAEIELPGEFLIPRHSHYSVKIARFMPRVEVVQRHNTAARRLRIRGHNGRLYPYLVVNDAGLGDARREERLLQLLRMLNHYLTKQKETSRRFLHFTVPRLVAVSPQMRLVEDNPAAISLLDIYKQSCAKLGMEHDAPIARYYEKLAAVQARGTQASHQVLRDILKEVQTSMVPKTMLKDWAIKTFPGATDYWTFRKMFTLQLSLTCFAEYVLHLTRLNPDMMYVHQDSGLINIAYFKFDIDDTSGELDANRPVPFRLTPNILEFLTTTGICGPLTASAIATARCLVQPTFQLQAILRAILRDEVIVDHKQQEDAKGASQAPTDLKGELLITMVTRAVTTIVTRLNTLANFDGIDSKVSTLVAAANNHDNLCRMDPSWHPWL